MAARFCRRPRLLIAGTHSGVGKSSITLALTAALKRRGLKVQAFKVGPDYLDSGHLARLSGRPCYNLDGWMTAQPYVEELFARTSEAADISLIEGVMGLFDGSSGTSLSGSSAEIAAWLRAPVVLVVDCHGLARSIAALVKGYNEFAPEVRLAGVIANRSGSAAHTVLLGQALEQASQPRLLGAVAREALPPLPERHLGLVSALERQLDQETIERLATAAESHLDLDLLLAQARRAEPVPQPLLPAASRRNPPRSVRLAVAYDPAFQFYYADLFIALRRRGCTPVFFSPLTDKDLPPDCAGLYLGGGYPEVHAEALAGNRSMIAAVAAFCHSGKPVYAECGGLIYLSRGIENGDRRFPLVGCLPVWTRMLERRKALGYVEATLEEDSLFGVAGSRFRGHEFHYSELICSPAGLEGWHCAYQLRHNRSDRTSAEGYQRGQVLASYVHLHLASRPAALDHFIARLAAASGGDTTGEDRT